MFYNKKAKLNLEDEKTRKIKEIYKDEMNNECFDCGKPDPGFISANNGIFICRECMIIHYQFPDDISLIIKNNLSLLNKDQINYIYFGGNRKLFEFINYEYPQLQNYSPEILYKTQAMQFYRDTLYYLVEGGNKPLKPNEHFAYKLIKKYVSYPMTEKRKKNKNYIRVNGRNNNINSNYYLTNANEDNFNSFQYNTNNNLNDNDEFQSNSYSHKKFKNLEEYEEKTSTEYRKRRAKIRDGDSPNIKFASSNNSRINFYQKRDDFSQKENRSFGDEDNNEEDNRNAYTENNINMDNNFNIINESYNRTHKVKRPKATNFNYNNYIKNTINFTNLYLDDGKLNRQILSDNINLSQDNINNIKENKSISTNFNRSDNYNIINDNYLYKNNLKIDPIPKKKNKRINIHISKKVYIKPKIMSSTSNNSKSPSVKENENNYNTMPNTETTSIKNKYVIINSDNKEVGNDDDIIKNKNLLFNKLSPTLLSSISNDSQIIFNRIYSNYSDRFKNKNNGQIFEKKNKNNIKYLINNNNAEFSNNNRVNQYIENEMNIYERLDDNFDKFDNVDLNNENNNLLYKQPNIHHDYINNEKANNYNPYYIDKINERKKIEEKEEDDYDVYLDKKMQTQRNITEEIKEEKYEDEDESENINENKNIFYNDENEMSDIMKNEMNTKENYNINNNININDYRMPEEYGQKNMEKLNYSGYNYDNNDSIEIVNDVDKFDNEENKNENLEENKKEKMKEEDERIKNENRQKEKEEEEDKELAKKIEEEKEIIRKLEEERIKNEKERNKKEEERKKKLEEENKKKDELEKIKNEKEENIEEKTKIIEKENNKIERKEQLKFENDIQKNDDKLKEKEKENKKEDKIGKRISRFFGKRNDKEKEIDEKEKNKEIENKNEKDEETNKKKLFYRSKRQKMENDNNILNKDNGKSPKFGHNFDLNNIGYENIKINKNDNNKSKYSSINDDNQIKESQKDNQTNRTFGFKSRFKANKDDDNDNDNSNIIKNEPIIRNSKTKFEKNYLSLNNKNDINNENKKLNLKQIIKEPIIKTTNTIYSKNKINVNDNLRENENIEEKKERKYDAGTFQNSIRNRYKNRK